MSYFLVTYVFTWVRLFEVAVFVPGVILLYKVGLKKPLIEYRIKKGVILYKTDELYCKKETGFRKKDKRIIDFELIILSSLVIGAILAIFMCCTTVDFTSFRGALMGYIELAFIILAFCESPVDGFDDENKLLYEKLFVLFGKFKKFLICKIVDNEYERLSKSNIRLIKEWIKKDGKEIAILILKLNKESFLKDVDDLSEDSKEGFYVSCKEVADIYLKGDDDLFDNLEPLFQKDLVKLGVKLYTITKKLDYINENESKNTIKEIKSQIRKCVYPDNNMNYSRTKIRQESIENILNYIQMT